MREILDLILAFIGAESLTDDEFDSLEIENTLDPVANYAALLAVLDARESLSSLRERLKYYYWAKGTMVEEPVDAKSNVLVGGSLED